MIPDRIRSMQNHSLEFVSSQIFCTSVMLFPASPLLERVGEEPPIKSRIKTFSQCYLILNNKLELYFKKINLGS